MGYEYPKLIVEVAKGLFGLRAKLAAADLDKRNRTADLLDKVAGCIEDIAETNFSDIDLVRKCNELTEYQRSLADVIVSQVSAIDRQRIQGWLDNSVSARGLIMAAFEDQLKATRHKPNMAKSDSLIRAKKMFGEAAGRLRALSSMLRV
jgi:hypothetical protein